MSWFSPTGSRARVTKVQIRPALVLGTRALWLVVCFCASPVWSADSACAVRGPGPPDLVFRAGFEDNDCQALVGLPCDGSDTDFCFEGTISCVAGAPVCSDNTGSTTELCNGLDDDCDGAVDEDFVPNTNPACSAGTTFMGNVSGDTGSNTLMAQGMTEQWLRFRMTENDSGIQGQALGVRVVLDLTAGLDYDLFVYCVACGGGSAGTSINTGLGVQEVVTFGKTDVMGSDDSRDIIVEVRHRAHTQCASWSLTVIGNVVSAARPCDP